MGASKINTRHLKDIQTQDIAVTGFELMEEAACKFLAPDGLTAGDVVLIKASFKNPCENEEEEDEQILYRRRVVPFVTRIKRVYSPRKSGERRVTASIENITESDKKFFFEKFFAADEEERSRLDIEGRRIDFHEVDD
ncbi:MAG: hypothetical protein H6684_04440 [Deltaproteobacteria bacterium]|nr:hypothetical protein [bacterium]MCB9476621.1 hypothetical protein [Deltaproteobacteria bacterium]MCB9487960.1 hypothetical protein [Deltaproteobacteria bacterium]